MGSDSPVGTAGRFPSRSGSGSGVASWVGGRAGGAGVATVSAGAHTGPLLMAPETWEVRVEWVGGAEVGTVSAGAHTGPFLIAATEWQARSERAGGWPTGRSGVSDRGWAQTIAI
jgi:hypothetical protein